VSTAEARADSLDHQDGQLHDTGELLSVAPEAVEVRRNAGLAALVGAGASAVAIAYLSRAAQTGAVLDWVLFAVMGLLAGAYLRAFVDARTPLLVADGQGVRIRLGRTWGGLPWGALNEIANLPRRGLLRDGRLAVTPRNPDRLLAELDTSGRRQVTINRMLYDAPFVVPVGLSTRVTGTDGDLTGALRGLAGARAPVVELTTARALPESSLVEPAETAEPPKTVDTAEPESDPPRRRTLRDPRPAMAAGISALASRFGRSGSGADDSALTDDDAELTLPLVASATPQPLREPRAGQRTEVTRDIVRGATALDPGEAWADDAARRELPEARELRRAGSVNLVEDTVAWGDRVRPIATAGDAVEPLVIDDFGVEPAEDPVVGPELCAARTRLGLSVDKLAERTRIRPHVIESIEVDDFVPCGGDFYARGHLRTLARVLGVDVAPLLSTYDERYADAPINPRRVFEAELATGVNGSIRSTRGGTNWSLLIGVVMALILAWSLARLVMDDPTELQRQPLPLNGSHGVTHHQPATVIAQPVRVRLSAIDDVHVVVRDGNGEIVFSGDLTRGQTKKLKMQPLVRVKASDGGALEAEVAGKDQGTLGQPGRPARARFGGE
jgi:hypothetical protein